MPFRIQCSTIMRSILHCQDLLTFFRAQTLLLQFCFGRPFYSRPLRRSWCTADASFLVRVSDFIVGIFSCVDRLRRVLCACSEKGVCRQYGLSPLCISCIYQLLASMAMPLTRIFHDAMWSALLSFSFEMCSLSDVADDLWLSLKLDMWWLYREDSRKSKAILANN